MMEALTETTWTAGDLLERLERCERFFVLDVRNRDEFGRAKKSVGGIGWKSSRRGLWGSQERPK